MDGSDSWGIKRHFVVEVVQQLWKMIFMNTLTHSPNHGQGLDTNYFNSCELRQFVCAVNLQLPNQCADY